MKGTLRYRSGAWRLQVYAGADPMTGKERRITKTVRAADNRAGRKQAEAELAKLVVDVEAGRHHLRDDMTVAELLERYFALKVADWSPASAKEHRGIIRRALVPNIGALPVHRVRTHHIDQLYADLRARGGKTGGPLSAATVRRYHGLLRAAFAQAVRWQIIAVNPADAEVATVPAVTRTEIVPPEATDVERALGEALDRDPELHAYLRLAATTGARRGSLCALHWSDLDLDTGVVIIRRSLADGGKDYGGLVEKGTKTGRDYRVAVGADTVAILAELRRRSLERAMANRLPRDGYVFARPNGLPWRPDSVTRRWIDLRDELGLTGVRLNDLRHYVATRLFGLGHDARTVAGHLGHASPAVTLNVYAAFLPERDRAAAADLDALLAGTTADGRSP